MISVNVKFIDKCVSSLIVSGHANYDKSGKDLVCAGVSAILFGGINALENELDNITIVKDENKLGFIINKMNLNNSTIAKTIYVQLKTIEESYAQYITIKEE